METRLAGQVDSTALVESIKDLRTSCVRNQDGVTIPVQVVAVMDPSRQPIGFLKNVPWGAGVPSIYRDAAANNSSKIVTVPANKVWMLSGVYAELASTATVGNRQMTMELNDGTNVIGAAPAGAVQAASLTRQYEWYPGAVSLTAFAGTHLTTGTFCGILRPGYQVKVYDSAAVDAAADDLTIVLRYVEYDL